MAQNHHILGTILTVCDSQHGPHASWLESGVWEQLGMCLSGLLFGCRPERWALLF